MDVVHIARIAIYEVVHSLHFANSLLYIVFISTNNYIYIISTIFVLYLFTHVAIHLSNPQEVSKSYIAKVTKFYVIKISPS